MAHLLPPDTLRGVRLGVSASPSPDLARLGLLEGHFRLALGELSRAVLLLGGSLQYCGHLASDGYTVFMINEVKRYQRRDDPISIVLAWSVHQRLRLADLRRVQEELGLLGRISCLNTAGQVVDPVEGRCDAAVDVAPDEVVPSLTAMRRFASREVQGRLLIGGRRSGYQGAMPGVLEEALLAISIGQPTFLAGGFGGVTFDIVRAVDAEAAVWLAPGPADANDAGWAGGINAVSEAIASKGWAALNNGLDEAENLRLAATHRASEIASLVSVGLGRLAQAGAFRHEAER